MRHLILLALAACSSNFANDDGANGPPTNSIEIRLVDAPATDVTEIVVTITKVEAHIGSQWVTLASQTKTVDLLKLQGGTFALLGVSQMPSGKLGQIRLYVTDAGPNYVTTPDKKQHPLTVPSGDESGIKLKVNVDVQPCAQGSLTLDFDGKNSIFTHPVGAGVGDEWILRPVVRLKEVALQGNCTDGGSGSDGGSSNDGGQSSDSGTGSDAPSTIPIN